MRAKQIELVAKRVEAFLLLLQRSTGWLDRRLFECQMKPLVSSVLLRLARVDPHRPRSKIDPPLRESGQAAERLPIAERSAVIAQDLLRHVVFTEDALELRACFVDRPASIANTYRLIGSAIVSGSQYEPSPSRNFPL